MEFPFSKNTWYGSLFEKSRKQLLFPELVSKNPTKYENLRQLYYDCNFMGCLMNNNEYMSGEHSLDHKVHIFCRWVSKYLTNYKLSVNVLENYILKYWDVNSQESDSVMNMVTNIYLFHYGYNGEYSGHDIQRHIYPSGGFIAIKLFLENN